MFKIDALRRFLLPCFFPNTAKPSKPTITTGPTKKRLSTSLRDDLDNDETVYAADKTHNSDQDSPTTSLSDTILIPPRPSKSMVIGTIFGRRRGHVWFCVQQNRLSTKPFFLIELPILTHQLVNEMQFGLMRVALECTRPEFDSCPLRSIRVWTMYCNGKKMGFASRKKASDAVQFMLKTMQSGTVGAGVIPPGLVSGSGSELDEIIYMRSNYERVVGSADSESFHLVSPDECPGQELSIFLLRSGNGNLN